MDIVITLQDIMNKAFKEALKAEEELLRKCEVYKKDADMSEIKDLMNSFIKKSKTSIEKMKHTIERLDLKITQSKKLILNDYDKVTILIKDKMDLQKFYNELAIENSNPEVSKLFTLLRDEAAEDIIYLRQLKEKLVSTPVPINKVQPVKGLN